MALERSPGQHDCVLHQTAKTRLWLGMPSVTHSQLTALTVSSMLFMEQMDGTILATALPSIAHSLHVGAVATSVALTSYIIGLAIFIPASGALADRLGSRTVLMAAIGIFVCSSLLCARAQSLPFLAVMRMLQGVGGALMVPVGRLAIIRGTPRDQLVRTMTWMMLPATLGPLLGPVVGGFITTWLSWRWNFYLNVPVGLLGLVMTWRFIPEIRDTHTPPFDLKGLWLAGGGLAVLSIFAELFSHAQGSWALWLELLGTGTVLLGLYARHATRTTSPLLDFSLMRFATFRISVLAGAASRIAVGSLPFLLPTFLQIGTGLNAAQSGIVTFVAPMGAIITRPLVPAVLKRWGFRRVLMINGVSAAVIFILIAGFQPWQPLWTLSLILIVAGGAQAVQFTAYNTIAYADIPATHMSAATSLYSTMQQIMLSGGICLAAGTLTVMGSLRGHAEPSLGDFSAAFLVTGLVSLLAAPLCATLLPSAGADMSGNRTEPAPRG